MPDLQTLLNKFLVNLYAGIIDFGTSAITLGTSATTTLINGVLTVMQGTGTAVATVGGTLFSTVTAAATTGTVEETLGSYSLVGNSLAVNTRGVRIVAWGVGAANANVKVGKLYFGATVVAQTTTVFASGNAWMMDATVLRAGAATQVAVGFANVANSGYNVFSTTAPTETLSGAVLIKCTGTTATLLGDLTLLGMTVTAI